jgi:hypothetical protein
MKPQELRIGNYVNHNSFGISKITGILEDDLRVDYDNNNYWDYCKYIEPIELTEEWLLKFGFKAERSTVYLKLKYSTNVSDYVLYNRETKELLFVKDNQLWLCKHEYVHHLQNLYFALVGEELTIK